MHATLAHKPKSITEITITATDAEMEHFRMLALAELAKEVRIDGFRPGHAPVEVVAEKVGEMVLEREMLQKAVQKLYVDAVLEHKIEVVGQPEIELTGREPFSFIARAPVLPGVTLKKMDDITVKKETAEVTDEEIANALRDIRRRFAVPTDVVGRPAGMGDSAEIDFEGSDADGVVLPHTASKNHPLELGSGQFVPGFEEQVVGMQVGEEKKFTLTFPADYRATDMAGKDITFVVKLQALKELVLPEENDAFAEQVRGAGTTWSTLLEEIKTFLMVEKQRRIDETMQNELFEKILAHAEVDLPEVLVHEEVHELMDQLKRRVSTEGGMEWAEYLAMTKKTEQELHDSYSEHAAERVKLRLVLNKLLETENITASEQETLEQLARVSSDMPEADAEKLRAQAHAGTPLWARLQHQLKITKLVTGLLTRYAK